MTRKEAFAKLKSLFNEEMAAQQAKLEDGTIISWEGELKEGAAIMVVDESGNMTPAPDATHVLEDYTKVTTVGGMVTKIEKQVEVLKKHEEMSSEFEQIFTKHIEQFSGVIGRVEALENSFAELSKVIADSKADVESKFSKVVELVGEIATEPSVNTPAPKNILFKKDKPAKSAVDLFMEFKKSQNK
jgi:hypothetical protein